MERVTFILQLSVSLLAALAAAIFAAAEGGPIPALVLPAAAASFLLIDRQQMRLPAWAINALGLLAMSAAAFEFLGEDIEARLLSGGHLLTYLTCVFLFQEKGRRQVWWLCVLSLLQVAVASLLTYESWFGITMPLFVLLMLWTLSVFQLQRAALSSQPTASPAPARGFPAPDWSPRRESNAASGGQTDDPHRWITGRFVGSTLGGTGLSLLLAAAFFLLIPRVWIGNAPAFSIGGRTFGGAPSRTGFTQNISLGQIGEIQESTRTAFSAGIVDRQSGRPIDWLEWSRMQGGGIRFRGVVQEVYDRGDWKRLEGAEDSLVDFRDITYLPAGQFVESIEVFPTDAGDTSPIVCVSGIPLHSRATSPRRRMHLESVGWVARDESRRSARGPVEYVFDVTPGDVWYPNEYGFVSISAQHSSLRRRSRQYLDATRTLPPELERELTEWIKDQPDLSDLEPDVGDYDLARAWERWFQSSGEFGYSLNLSVNDESMDPIMDFLVNVRSGHCEYYASALALLLRTRGIPTRIVGGYEGGRVDPDTGRLLVQDLHAHAWVEAYISNPPGSQNWPPLGPRWVTLDPTPGARESVIEAQQQQSETFVARVRDGWRRLWSSGIRMTQGDQNAVVYAPIAGAATDVVAEVKGMFSGRDPINLARLFSNPRNWFSWRGGLVAFVMLLLMSGLFWGARRVWNAAQARRRLNRGGEHGGQYIAFYQRLQALLAARGLLRPTAQTPREFALAVQGSLPARSAAAPRTVTELFYAVRFGRHIPSDVQLREIEEQLERLASDEQRGDDASGP